VKGTVDDDPTEVDQADIISAVEFNHDGELLATGDKGGRVVIFQRSRDEPTTRLCGDYNFYATFQSHEPEFDYLKSLEIEEKINEIQWLKQRNASRFLLTTNDKTIKLWKLSEKYKQASGFNLTADDGHEIDSGAVSKLKVPRYVPLSEKSVETTCKRLFANAHTYHINSVSVNSDGENFMSADDLRINLWNVEITDQCFMIVDIKPANMEELTEVITAAEFHPSHCNQFAYSSSKGCVRLCDMRSRALCDTHAKLFEEPEDPSMKSFFSEIISSMSDVKFSHNGRYLLTRDYLTARVWDLNMETRPVETYNVHEHLRGKLCALYENDCIFDKFECAWSGRDSHIVTGSYHNLFRIFDRASKRDTTLEASREIRLRQVVPPKKVMPTTGKRKRNEIALDSMDFNRKVLHPAWHPERNVLALAATNNLYLFQARL
jgi:serine/threonine-protein phosphatase 2A regulatory subunit B